MKLLLTILLFALTVQAQGITWTQRTPGSPWCESRGWEEPVSDGAGAVLVFLGTGTVGTNIYGNALCRSLDAGLTWTIRWTSGSTTNDCVEPHPVDGPHDGHHYRQMAYDPVRGRIWVFSRACSGTAPNDLWYYDIALDIWVEVSPATPPAQVVDGALVYDAADVLLQVRPGINNNFVVYCFAVAAGPGCTNANDWNVVSFTGDLPDGLLGGHAAVSCGGFIWIIGGYNSGGAISPLPVYRYATATRTLTAMSSTGPPGSDYPPVACDAPRGRLLFHADTSEDWEYKISTGTWTQIGTTGSGPAHGINGKTYMVWDGTRIVVTDSAGGSADVNVWIGDIGDIEHLPIAF